MRIEVFSSADHLESIRPPWSELALAVPTATPFQTWEWHSTWWKYYGKTKSPYILAAYEGNDLVALYPLAERKGLWRILRSGGAGPSDYLQPLIRPGYETQVEEAIQSHLENETKAALVDLHQLRDDLSDLELENEKTIEQGTCLVLDLPPDYEHYLATLSKSLRYDVRKLDKSLFKEGKAVIQQVTEDEIGQGLDILFEQHKLRWRKRGLPGAFLGKAQSFHHEWGRHAIQNGWLWLSILRYENQPIGAIYAMTMGDSVFYYQAGFDPAHSSISPGTLLVAGTIRRSIEEGKAHFDFLRGDEPYKRRWKPQREHKNLRKIVAVKGLTGTMGARWNVKGSQIESKIRARLEGKGLI